PINVTNNPNQFNNGNGNGSGNGTREYTISDGVVREVDNSGTVASYLGIDPSQQYGVSRTAINKPNNDNNTLANENNSNNPSDNKSNYPNTASAIPNSSVAGNYISDNASFINTPNTNITADSDRKNPLQEIPNTSTSDNIAANHTQNQSQNSTHNLNQNQNQNQNLSGNLAQELPLTSTDQASPIAITNQPPVAAPPPTNVVDSNDTRMFRSPVRRNIRMNIGADRFIIVKQAGFDIPRTIMIDNSNQRSFITLVKAIADFVETWGIAGERFYWQPVLKIKILNGGEYQFNELKRQLQENQLNFLIETES
ncbi:MAG: hypothetical protein LBH59_02515, partial [Planctomycetaceae bacterium]|nr:hypothetical protein [Planctomycetaceae bacterium]